jgi:hypothetical protein
MVSKLISTGIQINLGEEANKAACTFTASMASAYMLLKSKIILLDLNNDQPGLESLLKHKLWQVTQDPACKIAVHWVAKTI